MLYIDLGSNTHTCTIFWPSIHAAHVRLQQRTHTHVYVTCRRVLHAHSMHHAARRLGVSICIRRTCVAFICSIEVNRMTHKKLFAERIMHPIYVDPSQQCIVRKMCCALFFIFTMQWRLRTTYNYLQLRKIYLHVCVHHVHVCITLYTSYVAACQRISIAYYAS